MRKKAKPIQKANLELALITYNNPKSAMAEAYRVLRTNMAFAGVERPFGSILMTSASAQDGKSTIVSNLAVVTAQAGFKVLLVDCDLRKPVQHQIFQIPNGTGFTNCILDGLDPEQVAFELSLSNLKVLPSGPIPPNPAEILNSERTRAIWPSLMSKYDYVFIDSPPLLAVADASILASQVDGSILVVRSGVTSIAAARQAREVLSKADTRLLGVVLNQVKNGADDYYYE